MEGAALLMASAAITAGFLLMFFRLYRLFYANGTE